MHPVGRVCSHLVEESRLIDRRILVLSQMVTASRLIPSVPGPSSVSVAMQTIMQTYADASVEALNVRCMPRAEFLQKMRELVQQNALTRIYALLREMRSSMEAVVAGNELLLTLGTRAQIPTGYMVKTLRSQSTCDSNMPSDQMLSTF